MHHHGGKINQKIRTEQIHYEMNEIGEAIQLFDESNSIAKRADVYFEKMTNEFSLPDSVFTLLSTVKNKAQFVTSLKLNELVLFDRLLLREDSL